MFKRIKVKYFDTSHTDESSQEVIVYPVFIEEGQYANNDGQNSAYDITPSDKLNRPFFKFTYDEEGLIETEKGERYGKDNPEVSDDGESLA